MGCGKMGYARFQKKLGARIRALRDERGWTIEQLAGAAGYGVQHFSQVERGEGSVSLASLYAIVESLQTNFAAFFGTFTDYAPTGEDVALLDLWRRAVADPLARPLVVELSTPIRLRMRQPKLPPRPTKPAKDPRGN